MSCMADLNESRSLRDCKLLLHCPCGEEANVSHLGVRSGVVKKLHYSINGRFKINARPAADGLRMRGLDASRAQRRYVLNAATDAIATE